MPQTRAEKAEYNRRWREANRERVRALDRNRKRKDQSEALAPLAARNPERQQKIRQRCESLKRDIERLKTQPFSWQEGAQQVDILLDDIR